MAREGDGRAAPDAGSARGVERVATFSDGVFAIASTLLVLPLVDADVREGRVGQDLLALTPQFLAFALSFAVVGRYWRVHHRAFTRIVRVDGTLLGLSLLFLFWVALLPFPTAVLGEHGDSTAAVVLYAVSIIMTGLSSTLLWWYAALGRPRLRPGALPLIHADVDPGEVRGGLARGLAVIAGFAPSLPLAFLDPAVAELSWLLVIPLSVLANRWSAASSPT